MKLKTLTVLMVACVLWVSSLIIAPDAHALTKVKLSHLSYRECPPDVAEGVVTSGGYSTQANCFLVEGEAKNTSSKTVWDADVYGFIYDANNNNVFANRGRVGTIVEIPPGTSDFQIRITVPANQPTPLKLKNFKASGFAAKVRPYYYR